MNIQLMKNQVTKNKVMKKKVMKNKLIAASIMLALTTAPVMASATLEDSDSSSEIIGFSTGAIIGGIIAGPIGIVAAGTIGVIIGQSYDRQEQVELAEMHLEKNKVAMQSMTDEKQRLANRLSETEQAQKLLNDKLALTEKTLTQAEQLEKIKLNLRFEVDSSQVESFYKPQIKHLAMMMQENPELSVSLSGFSDPSGNEESNLKLSQARTSSVKTMLVDLGVNEANIFTKAFGESTAMQASRTKSSDFNNRRVEVELISQKQKQEKNSAVSQLDDKQDTTARLTKDESLASTLIDITHEQVLAEVQQTPILADVN